MKKSVLALLVLLGILIVTCVYQKTYTIYAAYPKELTLIERKTTIEPHHTAKAVSVEKIEEKPSALPVISAPTPVKHKEAKPESQSISAVEKKSVPENKPAKKTEKSSTQAIVKETKAKTIAPLTNDTVETKEPAVSAKKENKAQSAVKQAPKTEMHLQKETVVKNNSEEEIVNYLMWALKNRDIALKNRDEVQARIQELITKALNDRKVVIEERTKNEVILEKREAELIDARDASYENVTNPKTTIQGEK